jgi:hemoglobin/transferrin/lactoferrin receptor protein
MLRFSFRVGVRAAAIVGSCWVSAASAPVFSQSTPPASSPDSPPPPTTLAIGEDRAFAGVYNLGQMIVTAPTKSERLRDLTPGETEAVDRGLLDFYQAADLGDSLRYMPGVEVENGIRRIGQEPNIRGLSGARVLQTLDGGRINFRSGHKGSVFIEQDWLQAIEVVKGPASALYGSGALGGVLALRTIEAEDLLPDGKTFGVRQIVSFAGANEELRLSPTIYGRLNLGEDPADGHRLTYLLSHSYRTSDNYDLGGSEYFAGTDELARSAEENYAGLATFTYQPNDHTKLRFSTSTLHVDGDVPSNVAAPGGSTSNPNLERRTLQSFYNLHLSHRDPVHTWLNPDLTLYYNRLDVEEIRRSPSLRVDDVRFETYGFDLRNRQPVLDIEHHSLDLVYGVEYFHDRQRSKRSTVASGLNGFFPGADADQVSGYVQLELVMFDELFMLIPGLRYDTYEFDSELGPTNSEDHFSPKVGGLIQLDDELGLMEGDRVVFSANYAQGFRAPLFSEMFASGTHFGGPPGFSSTFVPNPDLQPETSYTWEVGPRVKIGDVHAFAAYYETRAQDFIGPEDPDVIPFFKNINIDKVVIKGVELGAEWEFIEHWLVSVGYSRARGDNLQTNGTLFSVTPDKLVLGLDYRRDDHGFAAGVRFSRYFEHQTENAAGAPQSETYLLVDVFVSWSPRTNDAAIKWVEGFRFDVGVENLLDEAYTPYLSAIPEAGVNPRASVTYSLNW